MESILNYKEEDLVLDFDEGINDPGIFKAIILAGGPGSGKSYVAKKLGLSSLGLVVVNSDTFFEMLMKRKGLSLKMPENEIEDREVARMAAKGLTDKRYKSLIDARLGILIDSTSGDQGKTFRMYRELKTAGYDIKAIFIQTDLDVALMRNNERARTLPPRIVEKSHKSAQAVKNMLKKKMGRDFHEIENNGGPIDISISGKLSVWSKKMNQNALEWIASVKRGMDSNIKEDINNSVMKNFKEYINEKLQPRGQNISLQVKNFDGSSIANLEKYSKQDRTEFTLAQLFEIPEEDATAVTYKRDTIIYSFDDKDYAQEIFDSAKLETKYMNRSSRETAKAFKAYDNPRDFPRSVGLDRYYAHAHDRRMTQEGKPFEYIMKLI